MERPTPYSSYKMYTTSTLADPANFVPEYHLKILRDISTTTRRDIELDFWFRRMRYTQLVPTKHKYWSMSQNLGNVRY